MMIPVDSDTLRKLDIDFLKELGITLSIKELTTNRTFNIEKPALILHSLMMGESGRAFEIFKEKYYLTAKFLIEETLRRQVDSVFSSHVNLCFFLAGTIGDEYLFSCLDDHFSDEGLGTNPYRDSQVTSALLSRNPAILTRLLHQDVHVDMMICDEYLLNLAIENNNPVAVCVLIEHGADVNYNDNDEFSHNPVQTPLARAVKCAGVDVVELLIKSKANVNYNKATLPLYTAAEHGHTDKIKLLLAHKAKVDLTSDDEKKTALMVAAEHRRTGVVQLLLAHNAKVNLKTDVNDTALSYAVRSHNPVICKTLIDSKASANVSSLYTHETLLMEAASNQDGDILDLLVEAKADVNAVDKADLSVLMNALKRLWREDEEDEDDYEDNDDDVVLETKADLDENSVQQGYTRTVAVGFGTRMDDLKSAKYSVFKIASQLIAAKANVNFNNNVKTSPLIIAAGNGHAHVVKLMIEKKVAVNRAKEGNLTPLMVASGSNNADTVSMLLEAHAEVNACSPYYTSALTQACMNDQHSAAKLLLEANAYIPNKSNPSNKHVYSSKESSFVREYVANGGVESSLTLMMKVAALGFHDVIEALSGASDANFTPQMKTVGQGEEIAEDEGDKGDMDSQPKRGRQPKVKRLEDDDDFLDDDEVDSFYQRKVRKNAKIATSKGSKKTDVNTAGVNNPTTDVKNKTAQTKATHVKFSGKKNIKTEMSDVAKGDPSGIESKETTNPSSRTSK